MPRLGWLPGRGFRPRTIEPLDLARYAKVRSCWPSASAGRRVASNACARLPSCLALLSRAFRSGFQPLVGLVGYALWRGIPGYWISTPITLLFLALVTPPIPLMHVLSYYDLVDAAAKQAPQAPAALPAA